MGKTTMAARVVRWQRAHGRSDLPWQRTRDAYRIWLSEVMLQQTQVATVIPYYERFLARFPDVRALARAPLDDVLQAWSGLGYYARARNLHRAAGEVVERFGGVFPATFEALSTLPGIGRSTAAAIAAFAGGERRAILDGNVKRVLARHAGIGGDPSATPVLARLWEAAEARVPTSAPIEAYTQGMMDLGASICLPRDPQCLLCPVNADCVARVEGRIAELPGRKARRPARRRRIAMLVVLRAQEVLVEKRPPSGIWGGLWSLPEADAAAEPADALRERGLRAAEVHRLEPFEHAFTHFTLEVAPWRVRLARGAKVSESRGVMWLPLAEVAGAALPSPVKRLLTGVAARAGTCAAQRGAGSRR